MIIDGSEVRAFSQRDPSQIPWGDVGADLVVESTGIFTDAAQAAAHLEGGAKKVVISAPATDEDITLVLGRQRRRIRPRGAPDNLQRFLHHQLLRSHGQGAERHLRCGVRIDVDGALLHQRPEDSRPGPRRPASRARAAAENIIPTSTGAARAVGLVIPELQGKLHGVAFRVPTSTVSATDFTAVLRRKVSVTEVNNAFRQAADAGSLAPVLEYCDAPLVSGDFKGNPHSCIFDSLSTMVMAGEMVKVLGWYDNEWGYACRTADLCVFLGEKGLQATADEPG